MSVILYIAAILGASVAGKLLACVLTSCYRACRRRTQELTVADAPTMPIQVIVGDYPAGTTPQLPTPSSM